MIYILLLYGLFASVFTIAKLGLEYAQPLFFVGTRMFLAGVILISYQKLVNKQTFSFNRQTWVRLFGLGLINIYLTNVFEFFGLQYLTSFKTCFIYSLSPFLSALLSYFLFSEKLNFKKWLGFSIGFLGFIPILMSQSSAEEKMGGLFIFSWPEIYVFLAVLGSVYGWILLRQLVNEHNVSPLSANGFSMLIGGVFATIHSLLVENWNPIPVTNFSIFFECAVALIIISNLVCYNLYGYLLKRYSATFISFAGLTTPLFTALFGWLFLGEMVSWPFYLSFIIVFLGLALFNQEELSLQPQKEILSN